MLVYFSRLKKPTQPNPTQLNPSGLGLANPMDLPPFTFGRKKVILKLMLVKHRNKEKGKNVNFKSKRLAF